MSYNNYFNTGEGGSSGSVDKNPAEQINKIGALLIESNNWGNLSTLDQNVSKTSSPTFSGISIGSITLPSIIAVDTINEKTLDNGISIDGVKLKDNGIEASGVVKCTNTTESTSSITGALICDGGAGFAKNLYVGGTLGVDDFLISSKGINNLSLSDSIPNFSGIDNTNVGYDSMTNATSANDCTCVGFKSGLGFTTCSRSTAIGAYANYTKNVTDCIAIGYSALNTTGAVREQVYGYQTTARGSETISMGKASTLTDFWAGKLDLNFTSLSADRTFSFPDYNLDFSNMFSNGSTTDKLTASGGCLLDIMNGVDGTSANGIRMFNNNDSNWGIYMAQPGVGKSMSDGDSCQGLNSGITLGALRNRCDTNNAQGFIWENAAESCLMSLNGSAGNLQTKGDIKINGTTVSTSEVTGALQIVGGGGFGLSGDIWCSGQIHNTNTTQSTSSTTGALICSGGAGFAKDVYISGALHVGSTNFTPSGLFTIPDGCKMDLMNNSDNGYTNSINLITDANTTMGIYAASNASGVSMNNVGCCAGGISGYSLTEFGAGAARIRVTDNIGSGFIVENSSEECLMSIRGSDGEVAVNNNLTIGGTLTQVGAASFAAKLTGNYGAKLSVMNTFDGTSSHGLFLNTVADSTWGIYLATSGANKALDDGTAATGGYTGNLFTSKAARIRVNATTGNGLIIENSNNLQLFSIHGDGNGAYCVTDFKVGENFSTVGTSVLTGKLTANGGCLLSDIQNSTDGTSAYGLKLWSNNNWGVYMAQSGAGKSLSDGAACQGVIAAVGYTGYCVRNRCDDNSNYGFIWENTSETCLASLRANDGYYYAKGGVQTAGLITPGAAADGSEPSTGKQVGSIYWNTTDSCLQVWNGSAWQNIATV